MKRWTQLILLIGFIFLPLAAMAGNLDSPGAPTTTAGHMPTLQELYNYLTAGTLPGAAAPFQEPATGPTAGTMKTLLQIYTDIKALFDQITASAADVRSGKQYFSTSPWGLRTGTALVATGTATVAQVLVGATFSNVSSVGLTGTMPNNGAVPITPGVTAQTIAAGYHNGSGTVAGDAGLVAGNIKSGVTIFGVDGSPTVMDTATGTAAADDLLSGKIAFVNGATVTGTVSAGNNVSGADGSKTFTIPDGLYSGSKTATANDANLVAANIKSGVTIFGVAGSTIPASGNAADGDVLSGKTYSNSSGSSTGTMPNNGAVTLTPGTSDQTIAAGYHNGSGKVVGDANLTAANIKNGVSIFGVTGTVIQASGTATAAQVLSGVTFSNTSGASTGTMPNNGAVTLTPGTTAQTIAAGYHNGSGSVAGDANLTAANIKKGVTIFGVTGTLLPGALAKRVAMTGQTTCYDSAGTVIVCAGTGQDGEYQRGVSDYVVVPTNETTGAYNTPAWTGVRFIDNGDGTVTDTLTALIWLKDNNCSPYLTWQAALDTANTFASGACNLSDGSIAGQWRLPNANELHSLIDLTQNMPALPPGHPFYPWVMSFWTSTTAASVLTTTAWCVDIRDGSVMSFLKTSDHSCMVWPVRGGQ